MSSLTRIPTRTDILTAANANGVGEAQLVNDFRHIMLELATSGSANFTLKIQGSFQAPDDQPDFSSAASSTNRWFFVHSYNLTNPSTGVVGSTGYPFAAADAIIGVEVNTDGLVWLNVQLSSYVAGTATVTAVTYMNQ